jgi:branched-chain amino acid transport system permease protein
MNLILDAVLNGIAYGVVVTLLGLGFTVSLGTSRIVNFAQGEIYMIGAFAGAAVAEATSNLWIALLAGLAAGGLSNYLLYQAVFRRLRRLPIIGTLVSGVGAAFAIEALWGQAFGVQIKPFPNLATAAGDFSLFGASLPRSSIVLVAVTSVLLALSYLLLYKTDFGLQVRALQDSPSGAEVIGLHVPRLQGQIFAIAGAMSGVAGVLIAWEFGAYQFTMGETGIGLAFVAAIIGGLGSIPGALIGGIALGLVRDVGAVYNSGLTDVYPYMLLVVILILRPTGIFGRRLDLT